MVFVMSGMGYVRAGVRTGCKPSPELDPLNPDLVAPRAGTTKDRCGLQALGSGEPQVSQLDRSRANKCF